MFISMKSVNYFLTLLLVVGLGIFASAQEVKEVAFDDLPPQPEYGKCFAKCKMPDVYEWESKKKLVKEASTRFEVIPAVYKNVTERVLVKEASTQQIPVPAVYETVTERVLVKDASARMETIPAKYRTEKVRELVTPAKGEWVKKLKEENCFSDNPEDCYVMCWEEKPAVYRTVNKQVLVSQATTRSIDQPAEYRTITKRILKSPASVRTVEVPAEYRTITKRVLVNPAGKREITIPAKYDTYREKVLVKQGGYTEWTEILCADKTTSYTVTAIQRSLKRNGYNPGDVDGVLGVQTQTALKQYQKDKRLPIGNLNMDTLRSLGVR